MGNNCLIVRCQFLEKSNLITDVSVDEKKLKKQHKAYLKKKKKVQQQKDKEQKLRSSGSVKSRMGSLKW